MSSIFYLDQPDGFVEDYLFDICEQMVRIWPKYPRVSIGRGKIELNRERGEVNLVKRSNTIKVQFVI